MAVPSTQVYYGCNLFWVREDWRKALGLPEPSTLADVEQIVRTFREMIREEMEISVCPVWQHCMETVLQIFLWILFFRISCISGYMVAGRG